MNGAACLMVLLIYDSVPDVLYANHLRVRTTDDRPGLQRDDSSDFVMFYCFYHFIDLFLAIFSCSLLSFCLFHLSGKAL